MAIFHLGDWHRWSTFLREETSYVTAGLYWLLHQIGWNRAIGSDHRRQDTEFCLEEHCLQVRNPKDDHFWQWSIVCWSKIQGILCRARNKKPLFITWAPTGEQADKGNKSYFAQTHQSMTWGGKGCMAKRVTKGTMGLPNTNRRNSIQVVFRYRSSYSCWSGVV